MRRAILACAIACLALAAVGVPSYAAHARLHTYKTRTTVKSASKRIQGRLSSAKKACVRHRVVRAVLFPHGSRPAPLGNARSDGGGLWHYPVESSEVPPHSAIELEVVAKRLSPTVLCAGLRAKQGL
jgi:hypothetical protein